MPLVFAAIAPHADLAVEDAVPAEERGDGRETRAALDEAARRFEAARPDATVVVTPHNVHVEGHFAVVVAAEVRGGLGAFLPAHAHMTPLELSCPCDPQLAGAVVDVLRENDLPALAVSFGGNNPPESVMPLDWGTFVPLWHFGARTEPPVPTVVVSPARDRPLDEHARVGEAIAETARRSGKRVALIASADHGHAHDPDGPYGFDPAAGEYDGLVVDAVRDGRLGDLLALEELAGRAKADSLWQLVVLHGALGDAWRGELLAYEAPRYYGMVVAAYEPL